MSNWSDIRIRITADDAKALELLNEKARTTISVATRHDRNALVYFGSQYFKLVWTTSKISDGVLYMMGHCRTGMQIQDAADILRWFGKHLQTFELNIRDDDNRVFSVFKWSKGDRNIMIMKWIPCDSFPDLGNPDSHNYDHDTMVLLYKTLRDAGQTLALPLNELTDRSGQGGMP